MNLRKAWRIAMPMILSFVVIFLGLLIQSSIDTLLYEQLFPGLREVKLFHLVINVAFFVIISLVFVGLAKLIYQDRRMLGFSKKGMGKQLLIGYLAGLLFVVVMAIGYILISHAEVRNVFHAQSLTTLLLSLIFYLAQGTQEEVITRGFILGGIAKDTTIWLGIIMSSIFFMLMHLSNAGGFTFNLIQYFLFGFSLAILRMITGNTWFVSAFHAAYNLAVADIFGISQSVADSEGVVLQIIYNYALEYMDIIASLLLLMVLSKRILQEHNRWKHPLTLTS